MSQSKIRFRLSARCEAAGRPNNEDNYIISDNLKAQHWGFTSDKEIDLGPYGSLLVVCDGMGGMNAGEVASAIAVNSIKGYFSPQYLSDDVINGSDNHILRYMKDAIQHADDAIKEDGAANPDHQGMGSTIVMAWLLKQKVYVSWCGDSRCYCYNPRTGLRRLSHDHSYVQELVDAGRLTEELAFDHPNNNIITRSLGDPRGKAQPDGDVFDLHNEDIIMLCSDGLCGCLRDAEIENIITTGQTSMAELRDRLWEADEQAGWHDNVTIVLAQILSVGVTTTDDEPVDKQHTIKIQRIIIALLVLMICVLSGALLLKTYPQIGDKIVGLFPRTPADTTQVDTTQAVEQEAAAAPQEVRKSKPVKSNDKKTTTKATKNTSDAAENPPKHETSAPKVQLAEPTPAADTPSDNEPSQSTPQSDNPETTE